MNRHSRIATFLCLSVILASAGLPEVSRAQSNILTKPIASLQFENSDVREALHALFKNTEASYTIAPDVQGTVTANLKNVTFEVALQNLTRQVDATFRIEGGVVNIIRRQPDIAISTPNPLDTPINSKNSKVLRRIKVRSSDPQLIALLIGQDKGSQNYRGAPELSRMISSGGMGGGMRGGMGGGLGGGMMGGMGGGLGGGMMGGMGGGMMGGMGGGMMGGGMMGGMGGGMMGGMGGMGGGMGGFGR